MRNFILTVLSMITLALAPLVCASEPLKRTQLRAAIAYAPLGPIAQATGLHQPLADIIAGYGEYKVISEIPTYSLLNNPAPNHQNEEASLINIGDGFINIYTPFMRDDKQTTVLTLSYDKNGRTLNNSDYIQKIDTPAWHSYIKKQQEETALLRDNFGSTFIPNGPNITAQHCPKLNRLVVYDSSVKLYVTSDKDVDLIAPRQKTAGAPCCTLL